VIVTRIEDGTTSHHVYVWVAEPRGLIGRLLRGRYKVTCYLRSGHERFHRLTDMRLVAPHKGRRLELAYKRAR